MAEGEGFEPPKVFSLSGFQDRRDRPLCHPSGADSRLLSALFASATIQRSTSWHGGRDSNPQQAVLETATLPIELPPYVNFAPRRDEKTEAGNIPRSPAQFKFFLKR
jgi:hypothetical protein